ncbi:glycosyl hydrolase family 28-related protein [Schlesneria sp.]|uniref:right-handed parallel beta-helix repeat-containing protein n=1 Tax=Schlesneria sp. TaxID=2762018 RepID=UPI002EFBE7A9
MNRITVGVAGLLGLLLVVVLMERPQTERLSAQVDRKRAHGEVSVLDFGAIGDGKTDDRAAIQAAIDAGDEIHFPDVPQFYRIKGTLQMGGSKQSGGKRLIGHRPCRGGGAFQGKGPLLQGEGAGPLFVAKGGTQQNRAIELVGLSALNEGSSVVDLMSGIDAMMDNCWLKSLSNPDATVRLRESYNVTIRESTIVCSGGGFAITAYQQCNKLRVQNCRLGGGDLGGAIHVEQSANVQLEGNLVELGVYGFVVSSGIRLDQPDAGNVEGAGVCHALRIASNYFENVQHPLVIGSALNRGQHPGQAVFGAVIESNNIGTYGFDSPLMTLGRLKAASIRGNSFWRKADGKAPAILVTYAAGANPSHPTGCVVEANHLTNGAGPFFSGAEAKAAGVTLLQRLRTDNEIKQPEK